MEIMKHAIWIAVLAVAAAQAQAANVEPVDQAAVEECVKRGIEKRKQDWEKDSAERKKRGLKPHRPYDTGLVRVFCEAQAGPAAQVINKTPWK